MTFHPSMEGFRIDADNQLEREVLLLWARKGLYMDCHYDDLKGCLGLSCLKFTEAPSMPYCEFPMGSKE